MRKKDELAGRMAQEVIKRLVVRRLIETKDEARAREAVRRILSENLLAEEKLDADARALMMDHAKEIRDSASDYKRLFTLVRGKLAKERGFTLGSAWAASGSSRWPTASWRSCRPPRAWSSRGSPTRRRAAISAPRSSACWRTRRSSRSPSTRRFAPRSPPTRAPPPTA